MESAPQLPSVLLVDDDASVRRALKMLMHSIGWQSVEAPGAKEALSCLADRSYNLVIIDINMPGMNGIELCRSIHLDRESIPPVCIILSGMVDAKTREEALQAGAKSVLTKPVGRQEIIDEFKKQGLHVSGAGIVI